MFPSGTESIDLRDKQSAELLALWADLEPEQRARVLEVATAEFLAD
ncbi:hypothetical protein [Rubripirellula obstinata]|nr:hypothetical protein [Rubripirellula obstinata]